MPNFGDLRKAVAAYMNREASAFIVDGADNLNRAINNAKNFCQRSIDFEYARAFATVANVSLTTGGSLDNAVLYGTATAVVVKSIEQPYFALTAGGEFPVSMISRADWAKRQQRRFANVESLRSGEVPTSANHTIGIVQYGKTIYVVPADTAFFGASTTNVHMDIIQWIPDFSDVAGTSFLLDHCFDFLQFRSIYELNFFLKEDQRVPVSKSALDEVWNNVVQWNATIVGNSTDATLD
jgi:hypothetical protein